MHDFIYYLIPSVVVLAAIFLHLQSARRTSSRHAAALKETKEAGLTEPPSLHPVVDLSVCVGAAACVRACPEQALGVINGKGTLINPTHCIGHGACAASCPTKAIKLVFGTAKRGMDIPELSPDFETSVPGIFIAGELGGMGLIRNAVKQGTQAIKTIARRPRQQSDLDVVIIGSGPAGIAASLAAKEAGLRYRTIEQEDSLGGTTYHYPRNKLVMTAPMVLPLAGEINRKEISKEELMSLWQKVMTDHKLAVHFKERMEEITPDSGGFLIRTSRGSYRTSNILLAIGRRGTPRKLGVPGENQAKVVYRLIDANQYQGKHVLVVGGGDSAIEAALDISAETDTHVSLSYRGTAFDRIKPKNRTRLETAISNGQVSQILESTVKTIGPDTVTLEKGEAPIEIRNDAVIICAGGELPTAMLKKIGIKVEAHYGT